MVKYYSPIIVLLIISFFNGCDDSISEPEIISAGKAEVIMNDVPFTTNMYFRVPYLLKIWPYEEEGYQLQQIAILDNNTKEILFNISKENLPLIYKNYLPGSDYYYLSIQIPLGINHQKPTEIIHRFMFKDMVRNTDKVIEGAIFAPRWSESPVVISSPVKGNNYGFFNQSTMNYHFNALMKKNGSLHSGERFATDIVQLDDNLINFMHGDSKINSNYYAYGDTLYAVASGKILSITDGRTENNGDAGDVKLNSLDEYAGNFLVLDIGQGKYAYYCHCIPGGFMVKPGDMVIEGQPLALLGNSGNSDAPHLHFQITDDPNDVFTSNGLPFLIKSFTIIGEGDFLAGGNIKPVSHITFNNIMAEQTFILYL